MATETAIEAARVTHVEGEEEEEEALLAVRSHHCFCYSCATTCGSGAQRRELVAAVTTCL